METKYLSIKEAAQELNMSAAWVYRLKDLRRIKAERIGAQWVISQEELERYKNSHKPEAVEHAQMHEAKTRGQELRALMPWLDPHLDPLKRIYCPNCGDNSPKFLGNKTFRCYTCHKYFELINGEEQLIETPENATIKEEK